MSRLMPIFQNRDFTGRVRPDNLAWTVDNLEWSVLGGCAQAELTATGPEAQLWDLVESLRCPVTIKDEEGRSAWWGYVSDVTVKIGAVELGVSIDSMSNRVALAYSSIEAGTTVIEERKTTAWAENAASIAEYGTKEWLGSASGLTAAAATARRDAILDAKKYPEMPAQPASGGGRNSVSVTCRGWWSTLGWKYAAVAAGTAVVTTAQISALVTSYGQFIVSTTISAASGISVNPYLDGDTTALQEIEALMEIGGPNGRRYLAAADELRQVYIWEEEARGETYLMDKAGKLKKFNKSLLATPIIEYQPPVGVWVRLVDVIPSSADVSRLADPTLQFIEGASWSGAGGLRPRFRGQPTADDLLRGN